MKNLKLYLVMAFMSVSSSAFAQSVENVDENENKNKSLGDLAYGHVGVSYNPIKISMDNDDVDDLDLNGISVGMLGRYPISKSIPVQVDFGVSFTYAFKNLENDYIDDMNEMFEDMDEDIKYSEKISLWRMDVPIGLSYKLALPNSSVSIVPSVGLNFALNGIATKKYKFEGSDADDYVEYLKKQLGGDLEFNKEFGDQDMKDENDKRVGKDGKWKDFQIGWNVGLGLYIKHFYIGLKYGKDFTELCKKTNTSNWAITLGYAF